MGCPAANKSTMTNRKMIGICLGIAALTVCATAAIPNSTRDFCTTNGYGYPLPWRFDYCLCAKGSPSIDLTSFAINSAIVAICLLSFYFAAKFFQRTGTIGTKR
jgi:hypothetical protein